MVPESGRCLPLEGSSYPPSKVPSKPLFLITRAYASSAAAAQNQGRLILLPAPWMASSPCSAIRKACTLLRGGARPRTLISLPKLPVRRQFLWESPCGPSGKSVSSKNSTMGQCPCSFKPRRRAAAGACWVWARTAKCVFSAVPVLAPPRCGECGALPTSHLLHHRQRPAHHLLGSHLCRGRPNRPAHRLPRLPPAHRLQNHQAHRLHQQRSLALLGATIIMASWAMGTMAPVQTCPRLSAPAA